MLDGEKVDVTVITLAVSIEWIIDWLPISNGLPDLTITIFLSLVSLLVKYAYSPTSSKVI